MKQTSPNIAYIFQAILILLWWIGIIQYEDFYEYFRFNGISKNLFYIFIIPDLIAICLPSIILSYKDIQSLKFIVLGSFVYATIFCTSVSIKMGGGELSSLVMALGTAYNFLLCYKTRAFKQSTSNSDKINLLKTLIQIIFVWTLSLVIIPFFILKMESKIPLQIAQDLQSIFSLLFFIIFSCLGLWSGYILSFYGKGTPLPLDSTKKLVISGPYSYVRNPMAICGIGQGLCIALYTHSIALAVYCLAGIFVWHFVVRKYEEEELQQKFGWEYDKYKREVKCWIPRISPYK